MDIKERLLRHGKKTILLSELKEMLKAEGSSEKATYEYLVPLIKECAIEPVLNSGKTGNISYPLYKKYRILIKEEISPEIKDAIKGLHPMLLQSGYLSANPLEFKKNRENLEILSAYLYKRNLGPYISRRERSYEIFGREKVLDPGKDNSFPFLLNKLKITDSDLKYYVTPEYCFLDYIPVRKENMCLLICENKDIWFNIRRCMFEDGWNTLFGTPIDGVVYGNGNKVSDKTGALAEYIKFMGSPKVKFLYWGDIDREGFDIFRRVCQVNDSVEISLYMPGYKKMIEIAKEAVEHEDSPSSKKQEMYFDDILINFTEEEKKFIKYIFSENKLVPQEIIAYTALER